MEEQLRAYQAHGVALVRKLLRAGVRRLVVQSPTGAGKGFVLSALIHAAERKGHRGLFVVHKRELVAQISHTLTAHGVDHGLIMAGEERWRSAIQLASIGTLHSWITRRRRMAPPPADFVIIDECHRVGGGAMYDRLLAHYGQAIWLGFTATPARLNGNSLGAYFEQMIRLSNVAELTAQGYLAPAVYMAPSIPDLRQVASRGGEFVAEGLEAVMAKPQLVGAVVAHFLKYAPGRKALCFASGVKHSRFLAQEFARAGIDVAHLDGGANALERAETMAGFRAGRFQVLTNAQLFIEGIDVPDCDCVIMAQPTKSLVRYLQMGGRGLRPAPGKRDCLVIDHTGNVYRHGPLDEDHDWALAAPTTVAERDARKRKAKPSRDFTCAHCGFIFAAAPVCPSCGARLPKGVRDVATLAAELQVVDVAKVRRARARAEGPEGKRRFWEQCLHQCAHRGLKIGAAAHMYRDRYGAWPSSAVLGAHNVPHGRFEWRGLAREFLHQRRAAAG